jgi:hypothetical protein
LNLPHDRTTGIVTPGIDYDFDEMKEDQMNYEPGVVPVLQHKGDSFPGQR